MSKKKICIIAQFPPPIHGLSKAVDTLYNSAKLNNEYDFVKVDITNNKKFFSNCRLISKTNADLYYFTVSQSIGGNLRDLMILRLLHRQGKQCLIHLHGGYFRKLFDNDMNSFQRKWNKKTLNEINGAIVLGDSLRYIYDGLVEDIYVVPNCVDDEYLLGSLEEKNISEPYHILYLSNFIRTKGYEIVLRMAKQYKEHPGNKKLHYDFAGKFFSDEEKQFFTTYIKKNNLDDVITYHGVVSGAEKKELLKISTFFILPTNYPKEGQPISILEAMGNGAVILTTNHAGIPDVVVNKENGCVLPWSEKIGNDYLEYINTLNSKEIEKIQQNNYNAVKGKYLETTYINNLDNTFKKAMSLSHGGNKE